MLNIRNKMRLINGNNTHGKGGGGSLTSLDSHFLINASVPLRCSAILGMNVDLCYFITVLRLLSISVASLQLTQ